MAFSFGDSFDCYAAVADAANGYWDSGVSLGNFLLVAGRFAGSQALSLSATGNPTLVKSSGQNDAVHHLVVAFQQTATTASSVLGSYLQLSDGATPQCTVVFNRNGSILLTTGSAAGATLATYASAFTVVNTWYAFEIEIVINNTTGRMRVRKNGNTSDDYDSGAVLNTRGGTANNYANRLQVGMNVLVLSQYFDDLFWRSDATSVAWMGDIRCYTRMPASDAAVQFSRTPTSNTQTPVTAASTLVPTAGRAQYTSFTAAYDGTIGTATVSFGAGYTGNLKCSLFASSGSAPAAVLGSANVIANPATGSNALTFGTPVSVIKGTQYWIGFESDTASGSYSVATGGTGFFSATAYASFPVASPSVTTSNAVVCSLTITTSSNATVVNEAQQDATTSYVYDSTAGHADFYGVASIASTPVSTIAVTTRGYMQKSDAGSRTAAVQLKSGGTTVASPALTLTTSGWLWAWRTDTLDPSTSAPWTAAAVNAAQVGPTTVT